MKVIIAGGRDFPYYDRLVAFCDRILELTKADIEIVSGLAAGADTMGERYAISKGYKIAKFAADWEKYGRAAGYKRNKQMAEYADCLIAFWDSKSKGTKHMIDLAKEYGLNIRICYYTV